MEIILHVERQRRTTVAKGWAFRDSRSLANLGELEVGVGVETALLAAPRYLA